MTIFQILLEPQNMLRYISQYNRNRNPSNFDSTTLKAGFENRMRSDGTQDTDAAGFNVPETVERVRV